MTMSNRIYNLTQDHVAVFISATWREIEIPLNPFMPNGFTHLLFGQNLIEHIL